MSSIQLVSYVKEKNIKKKLRSADMPMYNHVITIALPYKVLEKGITLQLILAVIINYKL